KKSCFLFGPRSTGKTTLIQREFADEAFTINLLKSQYYLPLSQNPGFLAALIEAQKKTLIVIDEVQKIPEILDEVHSLIEEKAYRFLLTGSSARKLKRHHANMLGGRASQAALFPLTWFEIQREQDFDLERVLRYGSLPRVYLADTPEEELFAYVDLYLKEEIQAEALVRNLPSFTRFLKLAALASSEQINYSNISNDVGLSAKTIREYYEILADTLLGFQLQVWKSGRKRKVSTTSKYYLFDCGVIHTLTGTKSVDRNSDLYGRSFEHFLIQEVRAYQSYFRRRWELRYWRTSQGEEVDLIVDDSMAIEIKATQKVGIKDLRGLLKIRDEADWKHLILVSQDPLDHVLEGITCLNWQSFLHRLWTHSY
ncbi:MAG: ATP-binding protein, partial [Proteobacteria bacterium]|nr:ATP-binding protein [Pseudomonadota bacterium]